MLIKSSVSLLIFLVVLTNAEEQFEPSQHICERCVCNYPTADNATLSLDCTNTNMTKVIADWPKHSDRLIASFSYNNISVLGQLPESVADTLSVAFSRCGIEELSSALFVNCVNIEYVDLSYNYLRSEQLTPDVFRGNYDKTLYEPIALKELNLAYNQIHSLNKQLFEHTPNLITLNLEGNSLTIIDHVTSLSLSSLANLQLLNVANNKLTEIPGDSIKHLKSLRELDLSNNRLDFVPNYISYLANTLEVLKINDNPIISFDDETFLGLRNLRVLNISSLGPLQLIGANVFAQLDNLQVFECTNNAQLDEIHDGAFGNLQNATRWSLKEIYINDNNLRNIPHDLVPWSAITVFNFDGNPLECTCDLLSIINRLPDASKIGKEPTYCRDVDYSWGANDYNTQNIYNLTSELCGQKVNSTKLAKLMGYGPDNVRLMRVTTTTLGVIVLFVAIITATLGWYRYNRYKQSGRYMHPVISYDRLTNRNNKF